MSIDILLVNENRIISVEQGTTLQQVAKNWCPVIKNPKTGAEYPVMAAYVDHKLKELTTTLYNDVVVEFLGYNNWDGRRTYVRSLCFLLQVAVRDLYPSCTLIIDHSLPSGMYCELLDGPYGAPIALSAQGIAALEEKMHAIASEGKPFSKRRMLVSEACKMYVKQNQPEKAKLLESLGKYTCNIYGFQGNNDSFHGPLLPDSSLLTNFALEPFSNGFCLKPPSIDDFSKLIPTTMQSKISATLKEYSDWCSIIGIRGVGQLNAAILEGHGVSIINISEALASRKYAAIADEIKAKGAKIVFIAGPSSSGKTSSSLRIAMECRVLGLNPKVIELDNYFVDREHTPRDENGDYDFESLYAMDLDYLDSQLNALLRREEVIIPKFDFKTGSRIPGAGTPMRLEEGDILIAEGIHALNPAMTRSVPQEKIFRVYASALTSLHIDENNNISTSDNRLLRRMIRDNRVRGISPEETILRWHSVRHGESRNIFPFQENADAIFNSALIFELPMLKYYATPLLQRIHPTSPAYPEAVRLLKFLGYLVSLSPDEIAAIPPTSIMREFIGGQTLNE